MTSPYSGRDHVRAAYKREFTDRVPSYPILGAYNAREFGYTIREYLTDATKLAQSQIGSFDIYRPDVVVVMADLNMEAEAAGNELIFPEDAICQIKQHVLRDKGALGRLSVPDPGKDGRLPYYLEACEKVSQAIEESPVGSVIVGPWAIAVTMRGAEQLIMDTVDDPPFVHELMRFTTELATKFGDAISALRVGLSYSEAPASCSLISPPIYRDFIKPYHTQLVDHFKERRTGIAMHVCGYIDPIMKDIVETGCSAISMDTPSSLEKMVREAEGKSVIIGNVATDIFQAGMEQEMEAEIRRCVDAAASGSGFILATGCEVPPDASKELVQRFCDFARAYGRYDKS
ncbi:MAG: uroporphyrinogen decarboxylase family protein [Dehalococcoidia bacterium]|jgi:uroporphyrinogen decarboxylase|nr:uroporphyrinogen decarboxylase family protein [Dehalococcoidia bacterium]MDP7083824.1 uroporphyrinogen decarboxylase family protein [Dehalococcoidia bacterium]MDP7201071.1 uroporphyrinogen decarboxylase family protein [Dehalococcoidia bacterium]MDP7510657.1 uroporphyrinogen decarboxylase family protein [Dehalococcoidia bacterium]HJN87681.1 uroporphyrinogen decarboxylase family protein [Dehalococcoidia bacterium]